MSVLPDHRAISVARAGLLIVSLAALAGCAGPKPAPEPPPPDTTAAAAAAAPATAPAPSPAPPPAPAATPPRTAETAPPPRPARGGVDAETLAQYRQWIDEARTKHPYTDSADRMVAVMMCESKGNATITNRAGPSIGLFQYNPRTWAGKWNDYRKESMNDPKSQIFATAQAWSKRMQGQWGCYKRTN